MKRDTYPYGIGEQPAPQPLTDEQIDLMAFNDCPEDWNSLQAKAAWLDGYKAGARAATKEQP